MASVDLRQHEIIWQSKVEKPCFFSGFGHLPDFAQRMSTRYACPRRKRRENRNSTPSRTFTIKLNMFTIASCVLLRYNIITR